MTLEQEELLLFLESSSAQAVYLENLAEHPLEDGLMLMLPMHFLFTHVTDDQWKQELEKQVIEAGGPFLGPALTTRQAAARYSMVCDDLPAVFKKENTKSKTVRRIVLDAKKAMRSKPQATDFISDLLCKVQTNLTIFFGWSEKNISEKTDRMLKSCRDV